MAKKPILKIDADTMSNFKNFNFWSHGCHYVQYLMQYRKFQQNRTIFHFVALTTVALPFECVIYIINFSWWLLQGTRWNQHVTQCRWPLTALLASWTPNHWRHAAQLHKATTITLPPISLTPSTSPQNTNPVTAWNILPQYDKFTMQHYMSNSSFVSILCIVVFHYFVMDRLIHLILYNLFNYMNFTVVQTCLYALVSPKFYPKEHWTIKVTINCSCISLLETSRHIMSPRVKGYSNIYVV